MPKKKTQIERAVDELNAQIAVLTADYHAKRNGLETAIDALKAQQRTRKPRVAKRERVPPPEKAVAQTPLN